MNYIPKSNQPLVTHIYTADPSAHVFEDKIYIYPSHDIEHDQLDNDNGDQYKMEDYHVLSLEDMASPCTDYGEVLHLRDVPWASQQLWAPDAAYKDGIYYLFFPARDKDGIFRIGIATSASPSGPFTAKPNYIPGSFSIDPAVFTDEDQKTYLYFGGLWGGQLENWQTGNFLIDAIAPSGNAPALGPMVGELSHDLLSFKDKPKEIIIIDENGNKLTAEDEDRRYFEGPWMHKYNGNYYLSYSTGTTHYIVYAISKDPQGPFTYQGRILEPVIGWTTHHSIVQLGDKWYLFYHDSSLSGGVNHKRCVKYTELKYNADGTIQQITPSKA